MRASDAEDRSNAGGELGDQAGIEIDHPSRDNDGNQRPEKSDAAAQHPARYGVPRSAHLRVADRKALTEAVELGLLHNRFL